MNNNVLIALFLFCCLLTFSSHSSCVENIVLAVDVDQEDTDLRYQSLVDTYEKLSDNEFIRMQLPGNPWNETHFITGDDETYVITLSHLDDIVYIMSVLSEDEDSEDETDCDCRQDEMDRVAGDDILISGHNAEYSLTMLDGSSAQEFLSGWAGQPFADRVLAKGTVLELHRYCIQSVDHTILLVVCGPTDQALEAKVHEYIDSLEIRSWEDLWEDL